MTKSILPFISILIPVRNEAEYLTRTIERIFNQDYPEELVEVFAIDGMSTDGTREIVKSVMIDHQNIRLLDNIQKIVPTGMNIAIPKTTGDIIIRVDGHCEIETDYISNCVKHILIDGADGVGGPMTTIGETYLSQTIAIAMSSPFGVGNSAFRTITGKTMVVDTVPFPAYTREIIQKVGLYDEELVRNQDDEYNYRIREVGGKLLLASDVRSYYYSRGSLGKLWKQYFQYGFYKIRVLQKHLRQMRLRQFVPAAFVVTLLGTIILTLSLSWGWILFVALLCTYLLANFSSSLITAAKKGWKYFLPLPICFAILHFSYGSGFIIGLFRFWNRWGDKKGKVPVFKTDYA
jgi:glycosyltransferase involved in cell wall biosynthesis